MANQGWQITAPGSICLNDLGSIPKPGPSQALVRIHGVSLNYRDILVVDKSPLYPAIAKDNLIPGSDGAGIIEEAGPDSIWKKGDRVFLQPNNWESGDDPRNFDVFSTLGGGEVDGTFRRYMVSDDRRLIKAPKGWSHEEAATIWTAGATAWHALFHGALKLEPGMTVLTQGTGGVSCYAIQIAAAHGATVIATSSSDEKLAVAKKLGAKHLINYRQTPQWEAEVLKATGGFGADIVVDTVGAQAIEQHIKATRHGGYISVVGMLGNEPKISSDIIGQLLFGAKIVQGILGAGSKAMIHEMVAFIEKHNLHPEIAQEFEFEETEKALDGLKKLSAPGKIVVKV